MRANNPVACKVPHLCNYTVWSINPTSLLFCQALFYLLPQRGYRAVHEVTAAHISLEDVFTQPLIQPPVEHSVSVFVLLLDQLATYLTASLGSFKLKIMQKPI